jgi:primosomal protein N' (replication factor Y)
MLAKGHDFPDITLAGLIDMDSGLYGADFRASERMAQLAVQVAGRVGRKGQGGRVLLQTRFPEHPLYQALTSGGYARFAQLALTERQAAELPPFSRQVLIRAEAARPDPPRVFLEQVLNQAAALGIPEVAAWGPAPAPMPRRAGRHRLQLLLQAQQRVPLHRLLQRLVPYLPGLASARSVRWSVDVDPVDSY